MEDAIVLDDCRGAIVASKSGMAFSCVHCARKDQGAGRRITPNRTHQFSFGNHSRDRKRPVEWIPASSRSHAVHRDIPKLDNIVGRSVVWAGGSDLKLADGF